MRKLLPFFGLALAVAVVAGLHLAPSRLFAVTQPLTVSLSIMVAAIFVRLNRGMPTLDWKSIDPADRKNLTRSIAELTWDYVIGLALTTTTIASLIIFLGIGPADFTSISKRAQELLIGAFTMICASSIVWMGYVVWRDFDIVQLQRTIIDNVADNEALEAEVKKSDDKITKTKSAVAGYR